MKNVLSSMLAIDDFPWHLYWFDKEGILLGCNQAVADFFGFKNPKAAVGQDIYQMIARQGTQITDLKKLRKDNLRVYAGESIVIEEVVTKNGQETFFTSYKCPLKNKVGEIIGIVGTSFNITEHRKRELALIEENKNQSLYLKNILTAKLPVNFYWMNKEGKVLGCNEQTAHAFGLSSAKEMLGKSIFDFKELLGLSDKMCMDIRKHDETVMKTKKSIVTEEFTRLNGKNHIYLSYKNPLIDDNGEVVGVFGFSTDITQPKELQLLMKATAQTVHEGAHKPTVKNVPKKSTEKILTLLVEDQLLPRKVAQSLLEQAGHQVVIAKTADEALEKMSKQIFDLILVDAHESIALVKAIRNHHKKVNESTLIVALTAYSDFDIKSLRLNAVIQEVVSKPLSLEKIKLLTLKIKPVIDLNSVAKTLGGNTELAKEMMDLLMKELPKFKQDMTTAFQNQDWGTLKHHVHKLHGGLCYTGAVHLKEVTRNFEKQLINNAGPYEEAYQTLLKEIDKTLAAYNAHFS